ncbi:hypothetical protein CI105_08260 [Candidatus Izimaplasma bacterium ZiA1]|uniref:ferric reductase-like transmembrane domain-containing protein n=1 Tax=Candidatus Izimoplasma sp. ZiA1 TaxID=2024899 RepID=UPI000BAA7D19|nr:hypothetical protein CI105_08260 [Candidatus Izimaplasma bacterium ZiA1]
MITIPFIILLTLVSLYFGKTIRKQNTKLYVGFTVLAILSFLLRYKLPFTEPLNQGYLGFSFLYLVMFAGALKKGSRLSKSLMSIRREYSIIGFILLSPHSFKYLVEFLNGDRSFEWFGILPYIIMLPLFVTSFMIIRKKMSNKAWIKLQRFAYIAYILIFIHLIIVAKAPNLFVYIILFIPYIVLKLKKELS